MVANLLKVKEAGGVVSSVYHKDKYCIVALIPVDGFDKLVGFANDKGQYLWVHKDFRK